MKIGTVISWNLFAQSCRGGRGSETECHYPREYQQFSAPGVSSNRSERELKAGVDALIGILVGGSVAVVVAVMVAHP